MGHTQFEPAFVMRRPWNDGRLVGAKKPLKPKDVWAIRFFLEHEGRLRDRALFDLAIRLPAPLRIIVSSGIPLLGHEFVDGRDDAQRQRRDRRVVEIRPIGLNREERLRGARRHRTRRVHSSR